jgi:hypothetical protein
MDVENRKMDIESRSDATSWGGPAEPDCHGDVPRGSYVLKRPTRLGLAAVLGSMYVFLPPSLYTFEVYSPVLLPSLHLYD